MNIELLLHACNYGSSFVLSSYLKTQKNFTKVLTEVEAVNAVYHGEESWIRFVSGGHGFTTYDYRWKVFREWHPGEGIIQFLTTGQKITSDHAISDLPIWVLYEFEEEMDCWFELTEFYESLKYY
jgi:hypothetical protein